MVIKLKQHNVLNKKQWGVILEKNPNFYEVLDKSDLTNEDIFNIIKKQKDLSILAFMDKIDDEFQENLLNPFIERMVGDSNFEYNAKKLHDTTKTFVSESKVNEVKNRWENFI